MLLSWLPQLQYFTLPGSHHGGKRGCFSRAVLKHLASEVSAAVIGDHGSLQRDREGTLPSSYGSGLRSNTPVWEAGES